MTLHLASIRAFGTLSLLPLLIRLVLAHTNCLARRLRKMPPGLGDSVISANLDLTRALGEHIEDAEEGALLFCLDTT